MYDLRVDMAAGVTVPEGMLRVPSEEWVKAIRDGAEVFDLMDHFLQVAHAGLFAHD